MAYSGRVDRFQQRHPAAGFPLAVLYKYADDSGGYLAALMAYYGFLSLFPLLLLLSTVLSFVLSGDPDLQQRVLNSALRQFPVVGDQLGDPKRLGGGAFGLVIGIARLAVRCAGVGPGAAVRDEHDVAGAAQRAAQSVEVPRPEPAVARHGGTGRHRHHRS